MRGTRALFASIGVSVSLVAAAALSLFTVSLVIGFGGWSAGIGESELPPALVFAGTAPTQPKDGSTRTAAAPVVLRARARARARPRRAASAPARPSSRTVRRAPSAVRRPVADHAPTITPPAVDPPAATAAPGPAPAPKPKTGDGVRRVGDHLSSAAESVGTALGDATEPLLPPVASAVQTVVGLVATVLKRTTDGLGATLDKTLP